MKVTHVISDTNIGGAGILLCNLIGATSDFCKACVILPRGSQLTDTVSKYTSRVTELPIHKDKSFSPSDVIRFFHYFKENPTDILHTHASLSSRIGATLAGTRVCVSTRHCAHTEAETRRKTPMQIKLYNFCTRMTVSTADFATRNLIAEGISKERIITIKNFILNL